MADRGEVVHAAVGGAISRLFNAKLSVTDFERMTKSIQGIVGKGLTYRRPRRAIAGAQALYA